MHDSALLKAIAIVCLTLIEITNLLTVNLDGAFLTFIVSVIAGLGGYEFGKTKRK